MPSSRARTRASRETCFSALSWSSAPTKSRLIGCLLLSVAQWRQGRRHKETWVGHPRPEAALHCWAKVYTRPRGRLNARTGRRWPRSPIASGDSAGPDGLDPGAVAPVDVVLEQVDELGHDAVAPEGPVERAVDEHGRDRRLERARQADADVGVLRLPGPVHDAAHDRNLHVLDAGVR